MARVHPQVRAMALALVSAVAVSAAATAQKRDAFAKRDTNGDGAITLQEWTAAGEKAVRRLDANGDSAISKDEFSAFQKQRVARMSKRIFRRAEKRGADFITLANIRDKRFRQRLVRFDLNGDGKLTRPEFRKAFNRRVSRRMNRLFKRFDKDGDGVISKAERAAMNHRRFSRLDKDRNGRLTREELTAARRKFRDRAGKGGAESDGATGSSGPKKPEAYRKP